MKSLKEKLVEQYKSDLEMANKEVNTAYEQLVMLRGVVVYLHTKLKEVE